MRLPLCLVQLLPLFAYGLNPNQRMSQYGHTAWRLQDGYFTGSPNSITQTKDGYLWVATINGLFRFDGVNFTAFQSPSGKQLPSRLIVDVLAASDGSLWFTSGGLLEHWQDNNLTSYKPDGPTRRANAILQAKDGAIWVVYSRQPSGSPLCRVDGLKLRCYGDADGVPLPYATAIAEDADRQIWISGGSRIEKWKPGYSQIYSPPGIGPLELTLAVSVIRSDPDGSMWVGMLTKGPGLGLQHVVRGEWHPLVLPGFDSSNLQVNEVLRDREGSLWIGTDGQGVYRVHDGQVDNYRASSGLSSDSVGSVFEDGEGDIWVGTSKGLDKFRDIAVTTSTSSEGLGSSAVNSVASSRDGGIWSGDGTHLDRLHPGEVSSIDRSAGLPGTGVTALLEDHLGNLWLGVDDKLFKYSAGKFAVVNKASGAFIGLVFDLVEDTDGVIWVAENSVSHNVFRWSPSAGSSEVPLPQSRSVHSLQADPHGGVWFAFADGDLGFFRNGRWEMVALPRGPKRNPIHQLVIDAGGAVLGAAPAE